MGGWFNGGPLWPPHDGGCLAEGGGPPGAVTVKVDTPVPSMAEQSLWEVAVPAGDPLLPAYTLCCRVFLMPPHFPEETFSSFPGRQHSSTPDVRCPRSFQSIHEVAGLEGKTPLKGGPGSFVHPGLPAEPLVTPNWCRELSMGRH